MLTPDQRHSLLLADRSRDAEAIRLTVMDVLDENESATLLDCEMCFRDAAAQTYLVMDEDGVLHILIGVQAWLEKMLEVSKQANRDNHARLLQSRRVATGTTPGAA